MPISERELERVWDRLKILQHRVEQLENNAAPTVPVYDYENTPPANIEGQVAILRNAPDVSAGGDNGIPWISLLRQAPYTYSYNATDELPDTGTDTVLFDPIISTATYDTTVFNRYLEGAGPDIRGVEILEAGIYLIVARASWFDDWGFATSGVFMQTPAGTHTELTQNVGFPVEGIATGDFSIPGILPTANTISLTSSMIISWGGNPVGSPLVACCYVWNRSGAAKSLSSPSRLGMIRMTVMRLTPGYAPDDTTV